MEKIKYTVFFTDDFDDNYENMTEQRLIEYAENRLSANNNDRFDFSFDTYSMDSEQAIFIIESYNERVKRCY